MRHSSTSTWCQGLTAQVTAGQGRFGPSDSGSCGDPAQQQGHPTLGAPHPGGGPPGEEARIEPAATLTPSGCGECCMGGSVAWGGSAGQAALAGGTQHGGDPPGAGFGVGAPLGQAARAARDPAAPHTRRGPLVSCSGCLSGALSSSEQGRRWRRPGLGKGLMGQGAGSTLTSGSLVGFASSLLGTPSLLTPTCP